MSMLYSRFFRECSQVCEDFQLSFGDVNVLSGTSYTPVNNYSLTRSWIDHYPCTETICSAGKVPSINYNCLFSDNFPMIVTAKLEKLPITTPYEKTFSKIKWEFNKNVKADRLLELLCDKLAVTDHSKFISSAPFCQRNDHKNNLETKWARFFQVVCDVGKQVFIETNEQLNTVPGWNMHVDEYYERSRTAFLNLQNVCSMRFSRA